MVWKTAAAAALLAAGQAAWAFEASLGESSRVWLEGDSTLHPYSSTAAAVELDFSMEGAGPAEALAKGAPARAALRIPVAGLKSARSGLDKNLREALKAKEHPNIEFTLGSYTLSGGRLTAEGVLSVAGSTRPVTLEAAASVEDGALRLSGEEPLLMSDFGIKPPQLMMGAIKTADKVVVKYRLELLPKKGSEDKTDKGEKR